MEASCPRLLDLCMVVEIANGLHLRDPVSQNQPHFDTFLQFRSAHLPSSGDSSPSFTIALAKYSIEPFLLTPAL